MKSYLYIILTIAIMLNSSVAMAKGWQKIPEIDCYHEACTESVKEQQQENFTTSCPNEADRANGNTTIWNRFGNWIKHTPDPQAEEMKKLCQEMVSDYLSQDNGKHILLAQKCSDHIEQEIKKGPNNVGHFRHLQHICEKMTGQKINIKY